MCQTLFYIPERWWGWPVFGFGWLLAAWGIGAAVWIAWIVRESRDNPERRRAQLLDLLPFLGIVGALLEFGFPLLVARGPAGQVLGLPIRGYGAFLLGGVIAGWLLSARRARQRGLDPELLAVLGMYIVVAGLAGARLFYVIQYWREFTRPTWWDTAVEIVKFTEGGMVVYGSLIGGFLVLFLFAWRRRLSVIELGDLLAPGVVLGMAIGRVGCLMNGCCFGGVSEWETWGIQFPRFSSVEQQVTSPPYLHQLRAGGLHGMWLGKGESGEPVVRSVDPDGPAARAGLTVGERVTAIDRIPTPTWEKAAAVLGGAQAELTVELTNGRELRWSIGSLPPTSRPVHPSQIYGAISGLLICFALLASEPYWNRRGAVLALLCTVYPIIRFLEEVIRDDEPGRLGTALTISQLVSLGVLIGAAALWIVVFRRPRPVTSAA